MRDEALDATEAGSLISADRVEGTAVYNRSGDHLGSIKTIMIDKGSGKVAYAVMSFGGFLGIGEKYHPLPWSMLTYHRGQGGYVVDIDKSALVEGPSYGNDDAPNFDDQAWGQKVHDYYRVPPYWT